MGRMFALSILHGGTGPFFLSPSVVDYLFGGVGAVKPTIDEVPDDIIQQKIRKARKLFCVYNYFLLIKLADSSDEDEFQTLLGSDSYDFRYDCGVTKSASKCNLSEKEKIVNALCLHYTILTSLAELEQLRRGLSIQKFDSLMKSHPQLIRQAFLPPESSITSVYLQDLLQPIFQVLTVTSELLKKD